MSNIDDEIRKAEEHLEELKRQKTQSEVKALDFCKELDEYSDDEKIKHFDSLHAFAKSVIQSKVDGEWHEDNDDDHYAYEAIMEILARRPETFWESYRKFFH